MATHKQSIELALRDALQGDYTALHGIIDWLAEDIGLSPNDIIYLAEKHFSIPKQVTENELLKFIQETRMH